MIFIENGPDKSGGVASEGVLAEEFEDILRSLEQSNAKVDEPSVVLVIPQSGEPQLPVKPGLEGLDPGRGTIDVAGFIFELILLPSLPIVAPFDDDLKTRVGHYCKEAVPVHDAEWLHPPGRTLHRTGERFASPEEPPELYDIHEKDH